MNAPNFCIIKIKFFVFILVIRCCRTDFNLLRQFTLNPGYSIASLDAPVNDEMDGTLLDTIKDEDGAEPDKNITVTERNKSILSFVEQLEPNQRKVITLRYGLYNGKRMNLEEVAGIMNLSIERVRQIESMALNNLRKMPKITSLHIYMD